MKKLLTICLLFVASAASGQCPFGAAPVYTTPPDANGETQVQAGWDTTIADPVNGPSAVGGTLVLCRRIFFNDNPLAKTQGGKNAAVSINHLTGSGTSLFNQDRALWVSTSNPVGDTAIHKSITGIQVETDIYGAPSFAGRGPDSEIAGGASRWGTGIPAMWQVATSELMPSAPQSIDGEATPLADGQGFRRLPKTTPRPQEILPTSWAHRFGPKTP